MGSLCAAALAHDGLRENLGPFRDLIGQTNPRLTVGKSICNNVTGAPSFAIFCEGWDTAALDLRAFGPNRRISSRFVAPTLRKSAKDGAPVGLLPGIILDKSAVSTDALVHLHPPQLRALSRRSGPPLPDRSPAAEPACGVSPLRLLHT
jgi:hypothetical protein